MTDDQQPPKQRDLGKQGKFELTAHTLVSGIDMSKGDSFDIRLFAAVSGTCGEKTVAQRFGVREAYKWRKRRMKEEGI